METPHTETTREDSPRSARPIGKICWFTLLVVLVLFFLCAPIRHRGSMLKAHESTLRGNLLELRNAITQFHQDTGRKPVALQVLVAPDAHHLLAPVEKGNRYMGPYLDKEGGINNTGIPVNPFSRITDEKLPIDVLINHHWRYDAKSGKVHSAMVGNTLSGQP